MTIKKLIGSAPSQISRNRDLGTMAFMDAAGVNIKGGNIENIDKITLDNIQANILATAVDVFVYDTSKDSDGGAWRFRTQATSWYNEPLNTAIRGSRREFPAVAVIVATSTSVTIYDGDDPELPMWMVFTSGSGGTLIRANGANVGAIAAMNGVLVVTNTASGLGAVVIDFVKEFGHLYIPSNDYKFNGTFEQRNQEKQWVQLGTVSVYTPINDVAITVTSNATIDPVTKLPVPTIAFATDGGVCVLKSDGTVATQVMGAGGVTDANQGKFSSVEFAGNGDVWAGQNHKSSTFGANIKLIPAPSYTTYTNAFGWSNYQPYPLVIHHIFGGSNEDFKYLADNSADELNVAGTFPSFPDRGVSKVAVNRTDITKSMVADIMHKYNTGWMVGDSRGAWLSDSVQETLTATSLSNNFINNGTFTSGIAGWTQAAWFTWDSANQRAQVTGATLYNGVTQVITGLTIGQHYYFQADVTCSVANIDVRLQISGVGNYNGTQAAHTTTGTRTLYAWFTATGTTHTLEIIAYGTAYASTFYIDNVSMYKVEPDRVANGRGFHVFGTLTKSPVATGADLVAYSGFSSSNYLEQPYSDRWAVGTGDFCVSGWVTGTNTQYGHVVSYIIPGGEVQTATGVWAIKASPTNQLYFIINNISSSYSKDFSGSWVHFCAVRSSGVITVYFDGEQAGSTISAATALNSTSKKIRIGYSGATDVLSEVFTGRVALLKFSATAPTTDQVRKMYNDEKALFNTNSKATLYGSSSAIKSLAVDRDTNLLHIGTSFGRSTFSGLERISNTTTPVATSISAANGLVAEQ